MTAKPNGCLDVATAAGEAAAEVTLNLRAYAYAAARGFQKAVRANFGFIPAPDRFVSPDADLAAMSAAQLTALRAGGDRSGGR